ncbi:hypothetical protein BFW38_12240 [Terasakiispira papahanaumokuakeensis]|uniref:Basal-body rod modification protein FlgD n=1 Tax=Terasakiispira papahanaumokuakeensis TaxID=197479 RepID=A0A1E2VBE4_9GAMM|nr:flagellar hook assembly protein FlgD [Terasakiispira papahanaumokuakeensis]ODC04182.1 hypothetical protein BFW38_12240 [Terasakiispira papahanaumokuakeensis]
MAEPTSFYESLQAEYRFRDQREKEKASRTDMGRDQFMQLLITQLQNQDPTSPQDNTQYVAQLAQFSSLEGIQQLNSTVDNFAVSLKSAQALQASSLVGRKVEVESNVGILKEGGKVSGSVHLDYDTPSLVVDVESSSGEYLGSIAWDNVSAGEVPFEWDGKDTEGNDFPPGVYVFKPRNLAKNGEDQDVPTMYMDSNVDSVQVAAGGSGQLMLNIQGVGQVPLSEVKNIK